ncbi:MAG TPA: hypothetical protein VEF76_04120 [Patescibacteria group bacterium]|nr:hypothetical protein [Patescibacteria group bacterium]
MAYNNTDGYKADSTVNNAAKIRETAETLRSDVQKTVEHAKEGARVVAAEAQTRAKEYSTVAKDQLVLTQDAVIERIRQEPLKSGLMAFGAGFVLALLLRK